MRHLLFVAAALLVTENVFAHARLLSAPRPGTDPLAFQSPKPRDTQDGYKLFAGNTPPCGNNVKSAVLPVYTQGQMIKFEWEETIQHPGYYVFQISSDNGATFTTIGQYNDDLNNNATPHFYPSAAQANFKVALPANLTCDACIVRMIQHMDNNAVVHATVMDNVDYFSCADVKIQAAVVQPPPEPPVVVEPPPQPPVDPGNSSQSSNTAQNGGAQFSSCALIRNQGGGQPPTGSQMGMLVAVMLLPLFLLQALRPQRVRRRYR